MLESNAPKELILHFVRDVGRADLAKGFENNAKSELPALKERIDRQGVDGRHGQGSATPLRL